MKISAIEAAQVYAASDEKSLHVTVLTNNKGPLTKAYFLDGQGQLQRTARSQMSDGTAETIACADLVAFRDLLGSLKTNQAMAYGVTGKPSQHVTAQRELHTHPGSIARDREHFHWRKAPGVMVFDHDAEHLPDRFDRDSLRARLVDVCPAFACAPMLWTASASSCVHHANTGAELRGLHGQHLYVPVVDATDIPRAGRALYERAWASGIGEFVVSAAGTLLDRNLFDSSVWAPEKMDFAAGAICRAPLVQRRPEGFLWEADLVGGFDPVDTVQLVPDIAVSEREAAAAARSAARTRAEPRRLEVRAAYIESKASELVQHSGISLERARQVVAESADRQLLFAEFVLYPFQGKPVSVGEILDNPSRFHGMRFADPVELGYRDDSRIAWVNLRGGGRPYVWSHAHGGRRYELVRQPAVLKVQPGGIPLLADECLGVARELGDLFDFGTNQMARVAGGRVYPVTPGYLLDYLGRAVRFERYDVRAKEWKQTDAPEKVAKAIAERTGERGLPQLRAVVTAPTLRANGTVLDAPGFDKDTGLLFVSDSPELRAVPVAPTLEIVRAALAELLEPFAQFPFDGPASRGVMVAALLSAVCRRSLPTCPAFAFDAPAAGTGKTLLARCVAVLGGHDGASFTPPGNEEELRKILFASLLEGSGCILLDNLSGPLGGSTINQFLTEPLFAGRVLGLSQTSTVPNAAMLLVTSNNFRAYADTCRRVLVCRMDAGVEQPYKRRFAFDPLEWVATRRQRLCGAALTLIRGHLTHGTASTRPAALGSFEAWDALVRQTVCWLATCQQDVELADPAQTIDTSAINDEHRSALHAVLASWEAYLGDRWLTAAEVLGAASGSMVDAAGDDTAHRRAALSAALEDLEGARSGRFNAKAFGRWLLKHKGEIAGGRKFLQTTSREGVSLWRAVTV